MPNFVIFFVDFRESRRLNLPETIPSPYGTLCRLVAGYGSPNMDHAYRNFRMMWSDEDNNLMPLVSDRILAEALRSRRNVRAPLNVYVKGGRPPPEFEGNGAMRSRSNSLRAANRPVNRKERVEQEYPARYAVSSKMEWSRWAPVPGIPDHLEEKSRKEKEFRGSLMPKDPSLAELVDNVRHSLEAALKSVQFCVAPVPDNEDLPVPCAEVPVSPMIHETEDKEQDAPNEHLEKEEPKENSPVELLDDGATTPRPCSSISGEFLVLTPSTDSCPVVLGEREFEAAFSEFDSEFEVVDAPDEWDSDMDFDWRALSLSHSLAEQT